MAQLPDLEEHIFPRFFIGGLWLFLGILGTSVVQDVTRLTGIEAFIASLLGFPVAMAGFVVAAYVMGHIAIGAYGLMPTGVKE